ncbi:unnamed protein product, partial [marine sediment metagenome]
MFRKSLLITLLSISIFSGAMAVDPPEASSANENQCSICLAENNATSVSLPCAHQFHNVCIKGWFDEKFNNDGLLTCPICRAETS